MAITYEWSFPNFECDSENKVKTIHWRYTATDSETDAEGNAYVCIYVWLLCRFRRYGF
jgi:hypothetical protein